MKKIQRVVVTGGCGQIAYNLLFRIASGEMYGDDQLIDLRLLDIPGLEKGLEGIAMELTDCAFPLLENLEIHVDPNKAFKEIDWALLVGAKPRGPGMERKDLLLDNKEIFEKQGLALNEKAKKSAKVLVVGNPCNTNALIVKRQAPELSPRNIYSMTMLDENRAKAQLAMKANVPVKEIKKMTIWGNHSATQVPDYFHAEIKGHLCKSVISDEHWLENDFITTVQQRGAAVIQARGKSSAASAANAVVDTVKALTTPTDEGEWFSLGIYSKNNPYGIDEDLMFSFPCRTDEKGDVAIVDDLALNEELRARLKVSEQELIEERQGVL